MSARAPSSCAEGCALPRPAWTSSEVAAPDEDRAAHERLSAYIAHSAKYLERECQMRSTWHIGSTEGNTAAAKCHSDEVAALRSTKCADASGSMIWPYQASRPIRRCGGCGIGRHCGARLADTRPQGRQQEAKRRASGLAVCRTWRACWARSSITTFSAALVRRSGSAKGSGGATVGQRGPQATRSRQLGGTNRDDTKT
jgi:hypothetical protein